MSINYRDINRDVNKLALEMVSHEPYDINKPYVMSKRNDIIVKLINLYLARKIEIDQFGVEVRKINIFVRGKATLEDVPDEIYTDTLFKLLGKKNDKEWAYNPDKGAFITAFHVKLHYALRNYKAKIGKTTDNLNDDGFDYLKGRDEKAEAEYDTLCNKLSALAIFLEALTKFTDKLVNLSKKEQDYYKSFFTFDSTERIKSDDELGKAACKHNDALFPYMVIALLEYLMLGSFSNIKDICINPLRPGVKLSKRGKLLEGFLECTHPTQVKYNQKYKEILAAIFNETYITA